MNGTVPHTLQQSVMYFITIAVREVLLHKEPAWFAVRVVHLWAAQLVFRDGALNRQEAVGREFEERGVGVLL